MLKLIAAVSENGVIGDGDKIPWRLKDDFKWFKDHTLDHTVLQGLPTLNSIITLNHKPLPGRRNLVLTRKPRAFKIDGVEAVTSLEEVRELAQDKDVWVIGGAQIYALTLPFVAEMYLTRVHTEIEGDKFFPEWDRDGWELVEQIEHPQDEKNEYAFTWEVYRRKSKPVSI